MNVKLLNFEGLFLPISPSHMPIESVCTYRWMYSIHTYIENEERKWLKGYHWGILCALYVVQFPFIQSLNIDIPLLSLPFFLSLYVYILYVICVYTHNTVEQQMREIKSNTFSLDIKHICMKECRWRKGGREKVGVMMKKKKNV